MIKALAALFMLIDHIGAILYPQVVGLRVIGRLSMPLFAYCIARSFYFTEQKGTTKKYARDLFLFAVVSQMPFTLMKGSFALNIGFTWLFALCLMKTVVTEKRPLVLGGVITVIIFAAIRIPMDYGLYGVLYPAMLYLCLFHRNSLILAFSGMNALYALHVLLGGGQRQIFSLAALPVLLIAKRYDARIRLPRRFFYWFYPVHIAALLVARKLF